VVFDFAGYPDDHRATFKVQATRDLAATGTEPTSRTKFENALFK
jgi:hypothetical protein